MITMNEVKQLEIYSDREIIEKILSGETVLYEVIIRRYNSYLYKVGRAYGYNHQDTEDLMQETYINSYTNLVNFENRSSFKTWITKIMLNNCFQKMKKSSFKNEVPTKFDFDENLTQLFPKNHREADEKVFKKEITQIVETALEKLPLEYRIVFSLRELNDLSTRQTSKALSISENNVKVRLKRAKRMLRENIKKMYSPEDIYEFNLTYCDKLVERVMTHISRIQNSDKIMS